MTTDRRDSADQAAVTAVLNAALDGEPRLDLDLGEVRRAGRWRRVDVQLEVRTGSFATDALGQRCSAARGERCCEELLDDATQLRGTERLAAGSKSGEVSQRTVQLFTDGTVVEVTASAGWSVNQLRAVVTSPRLQALPSS